jgi:hypothetical protein
MTEPNSDWQIIAKLRSEREELVKALEAARDWIVSNTSCESGSPEDEIMYERGWWDRDEKLMKQIDDALASVSAPQETKND